MSSNSMRVENSQRLNLSTLLLGDTDSTSFATGGLGVLTTNSETPVVTKTTVQSDLLHAFQIVTELGFQSSGDNLKSLNSKNYSHQSL